MCKGCLRVKLEATYQYEDEVKTGIEKIKAKCECEGCLTYHKFLLGVNDDLKVLCQTKIKKCDAECPNALRRLTTFEGMVKQRIKNKLTYAMETLYDMSEDMIEGAYITKVNDIKALNDFAEGIELADHN